ncbi:MAG TPA: glycosyltransferase [Flavitalea sp.]|nr:glycosyltransferase [Flavitalea sp.]
MTNTMPLVSVITPFLNGADWLRQSVESVIAQTYTNWQLILIDDGSLHEATTVAKEYSNRYAAKIIYTEHPGHINLGCSSSRNQGMKYATGELVALLDSDDVWLPEKLQKQVDIHNKYPEAGFICEASNYWYSWEKPESDDVIINIGVKQNRLYEPPELIYSLYPLGKGAAPCPSGMMIKKSLYDEIGGFENSFKGENQAYEDQPFLFKVYLRTPVYISGEANNLYRQRSGSLMQFISDKKKYYKVRSFFLRWMEDYINHNNIYDPKISKMLRRAQNECNNPEMFILFSKFRTKIQKLLNPSNA